MMAKFFLLFLLLFEIYNSNGQTTYTNDGASNIQNVTVQPVNDHVVNYTDVIQRVESKLDDILNLLVDGETFICNVTVKRVVEEVVDIRESLTEDATVKLTRPNHRSKRLSVDVPEEYYTCVQGYRDKPISRAAARYTCLQNVLWDFQPLPDENSKKWDEQKIRSYGQNRNKREGDDNRKLRVRKEYRTLTDEEREKFHTAMQALFKSGVVAAFGRIHATTQYTAHKGITFLPWHRLFILKFEDALQQQDPTVSLPYWDCTIDRRLERPSDSILWTDKYFGNIAGAITAGLAKGWTSYDGDLSRFCGSMAELPSKEQFDVLLKECSIKNVSLPLTKNKKLSFEMLHNDVHAWVGGDMSAVDTAAYDPTFYMMHAFFDCKWEQLRAHQRAQCGVNPETDYPDDKELKVIYRKSPYYREDSLGPTHSLGHPLDGMPEFTVRDGMSGRWTRDVYKYAPTPTCENNCGDSDLLYCNAAINQCMTLTRDVPEKELNGEKATASLGNSPRIARAIGRMDRKVPIELRDLYPMSPTEEDRRGK